MRHSSCGRIGAWGITGVGVYVDSYLAAGLLAVALMGATDRQRVILGRVIIGLCILNVGISVVESITQTHLIPLTGPDGLDVTDAGTTEFRGAALYTHPLTGALMTAMAIFLLLTMEMSFAIRAICFLILVIGLLSFGGRAALMVTIALLAARAALTAFQDLLQRRVNINLIWSLFLVAFLLLPILVALISDTSIGDRIMSRLYYDDSAEVRTQQWLIFSRMNMEQILFGVPVATSQRLAYQVGLTGVENPWILMFLSLGAIVLPVFLMGVGLFFLHLARTYPVSRWVLLAAFLITCTSNSVGTKSPDFFLMVACVAATGRLEKLRAAVSKTASRAQYSPHAADPRGLAPGVQVREPRQAALPRRLSSSVVHVAPR